MGAPLSWRTSCETFISSGTPHSFRGWHEMLGFPIFSTSQRVNAISVRLPLVLF